MPQFKYTLVEQPEPQRPASPAKRGALGVDPIAFGRGIVTPFKRDGQGDFVNASDISLVRSEVRQVLGTLASSGDTQGELPWRPEFGANLKLLRFRNLDETTAELARTYVVDALRTWLTRVRVKDAAVELDYDAKALRVAIRYDILSANNRSVVSADQVAAVAIPTAA